MEEFVTVTEASKIKKLSTGHIRQLCIDGKLLGVQKMGKMWIIPRKSLEEYEPGLKGFAVYWGHKRSEKEALRAMGHKARNAVFQEERPE